MSDLVKRQDAIDAVDVPNLHRGIVSALQEILRELPSAEPEIIRCKDCKWWDRKAEDSPIGYCYACRHGHYSRHWEISIIRTYEENFFCADAEPKEEGEENESMEGL